MSNQTTAIPKIKNARTPQIWGRIRRFFADVVRGFNSYKRPPHP